MKENYDLTDKTVYLCSPLSDKSEQVEWENQRMAIQSAAEYREKYGCRPIALSGYLPYLLDYDNPAEQRMIREWSLQLMDLCDAVVVFGADLSDAMRVELDHALRNNIPIVSRPESAAAVQAFLFSVKHRREE